MAPSMKQIARIFIPTGNYIYHTVQTGDTMYNISKKYQVDIEQIKSWNGMLDNNIQLNQQLIIYQ